MSSADTMRNGERDKEQSYLIRQSSKCFEHRELQATAMSVDFTGEWVLLAGRRHLALQRLGQNDSTLRKYFTNSKYKVSAAEFAICPESKESCAIATSQHIDVVTWGSAEPRYINLLRGHTRMVTDIDWHSKNPNLLVSCSVDTFSHIWDLRDSRKPTLSLSAVCMSGATQVGFNRVSGNLLAASHDGDLRIWDIRKGSCPIHYITAHLNRVHGINWSHRLETCLATASQDGTVKYFDINNPRRAEKIITASSPVWRARYTPIGNGLVSIVVPHLGRGENSLLLWSNSKQYDPVCSFIGHTDVILDFAWRPNRDNQSEIELVTWSKDLTLRVWKIDGTLLKLCEPDIDARDTFEVNPDFIIDAPLKFQTEAYCLPIDVENVIQSSNYSISPPRNIPLQIRKEEATVTCSLTDEATCLLHHEFSLLNTNMPYVEIDILDAIKRNASFKVCVGNHIVLLKAIFPTEYPSPCIGPDFSFSQGTSLPDHLSKYMLKVLKNNALQRVKKSRTCLEQCLRALVVALKKCSGGEKSPLRLQSPRLEGALSGALHDACIPFPRTSMVNINVIGHLCNFSQALNTKRLTLRNQNTTPRTLSAINGGGILSNVIGPQPISNTSIYLQERISGKHAKNRSMQKPTYTNPLVHIYDCSKLLNINQDIAKKYVIDKHNITESCKRNRKICEIYGRYDLLPIWKLTEMISTPYPSVDNNTDHITLQDPFKKLLLEALIAHFATSGDIQTAVILSCLFQNNTFQPSMEKLGYAITSDTQNKLSTPLTQSSLPFHAIIPNDTKSSTPKPHGGNHHTMQLNSQNNSLLDPLDALNMQSLKMVNQIDNSVAITNKMVLSNQFKNAYAELLLGWQLLICRALVLKHTPNTISPAYAVQFVAECSGCNKPRRTPTCAPCQRRVFLCILCGIPVKGAANACLACGHGGHLSHMLQWFKNHVICASGCGCQCLQKTGIMLNSIN